MWHQSVFFFSLIPSIRINGHRHDTLLKQWSPRHRSRKGILVPGLSLAKHTLDASHFPYIESVFPSLVSLPRVLVPPTSVTKRGETNWGSVFHENRDVLASDASQEATSVSDDCGGWSALDQLSVGSHSRRDIRWTVCHESLLLIQMHMV